MVAAVPAGPDPLQTLADTYVTRARAMGADLDAAIDAVHNAYRRTDTDGMTP